MVSMSVKGSAPDISGKGLVNPVAMILSVAMMMKYSLCHPDIATAIEKAVEESIENGVKTRDIGGSYSTTQAGDAIAETLSKILKSS